MTELNFTIGADPEISLLLGNKRIDAGRLFKKCMKQGVENQRFTEGEVGVDGCSATAELRPKHSNDPYKVAENIGVLIGKLHTMTGILELNTNNFFAPIGGHIHLSIDKNDKWCLKSDKERKKIQNRHTKYLAAFQLPIIASYNKMSEIIRMRNYGKICDSRVENREGETVMEYRAPNAEWLTTPKICRATLVYYAVIHNEILNNFEAFSKECETIIASSNYQYEALQQLMLSNYAQISKGIIEQTKKVIKKCSLYEEYKADIDYIMDIKQVYKDKEEAGFNIAKGWGLEKITKISKKKMFNEKEIKKNIETKDIDVLASFLDIAYNKDHNCQVFANALAKRQIAYNWKFDNYYYIYGLRKELKDYIVSDEESKIYKEITQITGSKDVGNLMSLLNKVGGKLQEAIYSNKQIRAIELTKYLNKKLFMIGIPYKDREDMNIKPFLEIIYDIEKKKLKPIDLKVEYKEEIGELSKILSKERGIDETAEDTGSQGREFAASAIVESLNETIE